MAKFKTDEISFGTNLSLGDLQNKLRDAQQKTKADVEKIQSSDAFGDMGNHSDIEVAFSGHGNALSALKHFGPNSAHSDWEVQVFVDDKGNTRQVTLVAIGETLGSQVFTMQAHRLFNFGLSKEKRDKIAEFLR